MQPNISLYHIEDHQLFVEGIYSLIKKENNITWLGSAFTGTDGVRDVLRLQPDVVLLDYFLPDMNGLEAAQKILNLLPTTSILILSMESSAELIKKCRANGILGFLPKTTDKQSLLQAIQSVHQKIPVFPAIEEIPKEIPSGLNVLSKREKEIAILIAQGFTSAQISEKLFLSLLTVNTHRRNLIHKLKLSNTAQLSAWVSKLNQEDI
ncbi:MAG: response regulator [Mongoliitalea sp.]